MRIRRGFNARELLASLTSDSRAYQYRQLPSPRSIRLLELYPASASDSGGNIAVSLRTFSVDDAPPFKALSYTWGYPLIPESPPSRSSNWRRLAFIQRLQARASRSQDAEGRLSATSTPSSPISSSQSLSSVLRVKVNENTPCFPIKCEGRHLRVTANLHDALGMLARRSQHDHVNFPAKKQFLWVDAL